MNNIITNLHSAVVKYVWFKNTHFMLPMRMRGEYGNSAFDAELTSDSKS